MMDEWIQDLNQKHIMTVTEPKVYSHTSNAKQKTEWATEWPLVP